MPAVRNVSKSGKTGLAARLGSTGKPARTDEHSTGVRPPVFRGRDSRLATPARGSPRSTAPAEVAASVAGLPLTI